MFSMEKILDWRSDLEEEAKRKFVSLQQNWDDENQNLNILISENTKIKSDHLKQKEIQSMRYNDYYKMMIDEKIVQQRNLLDRILIQIQSAQEELGLAHTDKKAMEKLKEKEFIAITAAEQYSEQRQLDDIATMNFKRRVF